VKRALILTAALVLLLATPAAAHVAVSPASVPPGEVAELTFRVPDEDAAASTTSVKVALPESPVLDFVSVSPAPGWTHTEERSGDRITSVTWSGGKIEPGEFETFSIAVGPIAGDALEFRVVQTYDNGDVVRWIDPATDGGEEPEHPAPTVRVGSSDADGEGSPIATASNDQGVDGTSTATFALLALGGLALMGAVAALVMGRSRVPS
jgi:uncharacterized protein YcnI